MKKLMVLGMSAALSAAMLGGCASGEQNTSNTIRNQTSNGPMNAMTNTMTNSPMNSNMNSGMNSNMMSNANGSNTATVQDNFWINAAQGGLAEVEMSRVAATKATNAEVKQFAQMMIADHTKANAELKTLAAKKNVALPTEVTSSQRSAIDDLSKLSGAEFDRRYVEAMVDAHETDVDLFEDNTDNSDADVKAFATKTLPTLKKHLETIKGIQGKLK